MKLDQTLGSGLAWLLVRPICTIWYRVCRLKWKDYDLGFDYFITWQIILFMVCSYGFRSIREIIKYMFFFLLFFCHRSTFDMGWKNINMYTTLCNRSFSFCLIKCIKFVFQCRCRCRFRFSYVVEYSILCVDFNLMIASVYESAHIKELEGNVKVFFVVCTWQWKIETVDIRFEWKFNYFFPIQQRQRKIRKNTQNENDGRMGSEQLPAWQQHPNISNQIRKWNEKKMTK